MQPTGSQGKKHNSQACQHNILSMLLPPRPATYLPQHILLRPHARSSWFPCSYWPFSLLVARQQVAAPGSKLLLTSTMRHECWGLRHVQHTALYALLVCAAFLPLTATGNALPNPLHGTHKHVPPSQIFLEFFRLLHLLFPLLHHVPWSPLDTQRVLLLLFHFDASQTTNLK